MDAVEQIKARLPLEDVISETVALKPAGKDRLKGLCPFHTEKTPSFHVVTDKGFYYCHACHAKGDLFSFVRNTQNLDFRAALELLAARAGVELPKRTERESRKRDLYDLNKLAQEFFVAKLAERAEVRDYLSGRGFTPETISAWGLGYAPEGWTNLTQHARTHGVELETLEAAGLAKNKDGRFYDLFRHRVTIPIRDLFGRVVGFSARVLADEQPKYVNTPETAAFKKGELLFGLDQAKATIRESRAAILVEGQLDVVALHQAGFTAAVGAQSATLTGAQITALERLGVTTLYLAFDADEAGQRATLAGCKAVARRFVVKIVRLPHKDPAETVTDDPELFRTVLETAQTEAEYCFAHAKTEYGSTTPEERLKLFKHLAPHLRDLATPGDGQELRRLYAAEVGSDEAEVKRLLKTPACPPKAAERKAGETGDHADLTAQLMALALHSRKFLVEACAQIEAQVPAGDPLETFAAAAARAQYDPARVLEQHQEREDSTLHRLVARGVGQPHRAFKLALQHYTASQPKPAKLLEADPPSAAAPPNDRPLRPPRDEYEKLRALISEYEPGPTRDKLDDSFQRADNGDPVALVAIKAYLERSDVRQFMGLLPLNPHGQEGQQTA